MQRKHITKYAVALSMAAMVMVPNAFALSWMDGAPAKYHFTYNGDNGGIATVFASDSNNTFNGEVEKGQTITTQTGTIAWRSTYTNTTTFTVDVEPGYYLSALTGNVGDAQFTKKDTDTYTFQFTDKGAEAWCFGDDVSFDLVTEKIPYTVNFDVDGQQVDSTTATVNDSLTLPENPTKEGYTFVGWFLNDQKVGNTLTPEMLQSATEEHVISLQAKFTVNTYPVTIHYYTNSNDKDLGGKLTSTIDNIQVDYGTQIDEAWLKNHSYLSGSTMLGGDHTVTVGTEGAVIDLVEKDTSSGANAYFTLTDKDSGVLQVTCSINGGKTCAFDVKETAALSAGDAIWDKAVITFNVVVEDGKELTLDCSDGSKNVEKNADGTYSFHFTRYHLSNTDDVTFSLSTH